MNSLALKDPGPSNIFPAPGLNRIWRWVEPGTLPGKQLVALFDQTKNLMVVDKVKFAQLTPDEQERMLKSDAPVHEIEWMPA